MNLGGLEQFQAEFRGEGNVRMPCHECGELSVRGTSDTRDLRLRCYFVCFKCAHSTEVVIDVREIALLENQEALRDLVSNKYKEASATAVSKMQARRDEAKKRRDEAEW